MTSLLGKNSGSSRHALQMMQSVPEEDMKNENISYTGEEAASSSDGHDDSDSVEIASNETRLVHYSKVLVVGVIVIVAIIIGFITLTFVKQQEESTYRAHFFDVSNELVGVSQARAREIFDNLEAFSAMLTSFAVAANAEWPFVVIPDFQVHAIVSNKITGASTLTVNPIVETKDRELWEQFSIEHWNWMADGHRWDKEVNPDLYEDVRFNSTLRRPNTEDNRWNNTGIEPFIWEFGANASRIPVVNEPGPYYPVWQRAPSSDYSPFVNLNLPSLSIFERIIEGMLETDQAVLTRVTDATYLDTNYERRFNPALQDEPCSYLLQPIHDTLKLDRRIVGFLSAFFRWGVFYENILPSTEQGLILVMYGTCGDMFSYELIGNRPFYLGKGDMHDPAYSNMGVNFDITPFVKLEENTDEKYCQYSATIYPSSKFQDPFFTKKPWWYALMVVSCFVLTTIVFVIYDFVVQKRQKTIMEHATKSNAIVTSLFPSNVKDRLMEEMNVDKDAKKQTWAEKRAFLNSNTRENNNVYGCATSETLFGSQPIADLFPESTIMFADMVGFTAWASIREPTQVFTLLETVYHSFDMIAKRRRVFKVETIGDCYVACAGVPTQRKDHGLVMAKFSFECLARMNELVRDLETSLGPDTANLRMRIGLHSGPVTAGVLRGEKGRFQLFGDTMNTASRVESTGKRNMIQVSQETADLLIAAGKEKWLTAREDKVFAKGKGELQTYWLQIPEESDADTGSASTGHTNDIGDRKLQELLKNQLNGLKMGDDEDGVAETHGVVVLNDKACRLVKWNVDILSRLLRQVIARRESTPGFQRTNHSGNLAHQRGDGGSLGGGAIIDEVTNVLSLPRFDANVYQKQVDPASVTLSPNVVNQLEDFVSKVAAMYRNNPFHNFEHASHVTMSVTKLMGRIVSPDVSPSSSSDDKIAADMHDHTFGITSDPLTQLACVLSALIHDADHPGVPNSTLASEEDPVALKFDYKSVAEQNSIDLCWQLLMKPEYSDLRMCIYGNEEEYERFRAVIINSVLATDIMDKDLAALRKSRWAKAFSSDFTSVDEDDHTNANRKATIILEHLIQASDVSHTMQHWHIFKKWNQRLFNEMYSAYKAGRIEKDPSDNWYNGELGFFDFYIIPLARKLETCGVFGVSSHEYLSYALANRREWESKGQTIVKEYMAVVTAQEDMEVPVSQEKVEGKNEEPTTTCARSA